MNKMRETLAAGRPSFGSWISIADSNTAEVMARAGFDWLILDTQHGGLGWDNLLGLMQAVQLGGASPLVRVGWNDAAQIMRALDLGAAGVIVPMVSSAEEAQSAVQAVRYPPEGQRSFGKVRSYLSGEPGEAAPLCFVMIETAQALRNLDAIAATPGVDGLFIGPVDLGLSLGLGVSPAMHDTVLAAVHDVVAACRRRGLIAACPSLGLANAKKLWDCGVQCITLGSDVGYVRRGASVDLAEAHGWADAARA